jgi:hypothetical protein
MESLNKTFFKFTGLTCDVKSLFDNCTTDEEKTKLFQSLSWRMKRGALLNNVEGNKNAKMFANIMNELSKLANIELSEELIDIDKDGDIDSNDEKILNDLKQVDDILSSLEIVTEPATEPVTEPVTEEVTEPVTEEVTEPVTEEVTEE